MAPLFSKEPKALPHWTQQLPARSSSSVGRYAGLSGAEGLASAIRKYLKTDIIFKKLTAANKHMDIMAGSIVLAMGAGTPLQTVGVEGLSETCSIFINKYDQKMTIFTFWHAGIDVDGR
jgi:hypothetical protein